MKRKDEVLLQIFAKDGDTGDNGSLPLSGSTTESKEENGSAGAGREFMNIEEEANGKADTDTIDRDAGKEDADSEFERLIKGKYASEFARRTQKIIDKRFRQTKLGEVENQRLSALVKQIGEKLGCTEEELLSTLESRLSAGSEKERPRRILPESSEMEREASARFGGFELSRCMDDRSFREYLEMGLTYSEAYALTNLESIKKNAAGEGAKEAVRSIGSLGSRMPEFTAASQGAPAFRPVSSLTSAEIREIVERAAAGERIDLAGLGLI